MKIIIKNLSFVKNSWKIHEKFMENSLNFYKDALFIIKLFIHYVL